MARTGVIIPFYQRARGILPASVDSVLIQGEESVAVIVVDGGSPVSARMELAPILQRDPRVTVIEQHNAGPGGARNKGLDAAPDDVTQIAYLDSDDRWFPGHLSNGLAALRHGADFYFADADHSPRGMEPSRFAKCGIDRTVGEPIEGLEDLVFYKRTFSTK
ncbi:MAG: glycosyltransferase family 2 protein [Ktedonobacteraceae bacterium]